MVLSYLFDADLVVKTTSYLPQKMFDDIILKSTAVNSSMIHQSVWPGEGDEKLGNLYCVATKHTNNNTLILKLASVDANNIVVNTQVQGSTTSSIGVAYILTAGPCIDPATVHNTIDNPNAISIATISVQTTDGTFSITVPL